MATMAKIRVFGLLALALVFGVNNEAWGEDFLPLVSKTNITYTSNGTGEDWANAANWTPDRSDGGYFPGQALFNNSPDGNFGRGIVVVNKKITMGDISNYIYDNRTKTYTTVSLIFDIQKLTLNTGADLTLNSDLYVTGGNKQDPCYIYSAGSLTIKEGKTLWVEKTFQLNADQTINGGGKLVIHRAVTGNNHKLIANVDIDINPNDHGEHGNKISNLDLIVNKKVTINRNNNLTLNNVTINSGGEYVTNYNSSCNYLTMNGGTLDIENNKTLTINKTTKINGEKNGLKTLFVNENATIIGNGTLDVARIVVATGKILTINGNITLNQSVTLDGNIAVAEGKTLTLSSNQITFTGNSYFGNGTGIVEFTSDNASIRSVTTCVGGNFKSLKTVTYANSCTYMLPGLFNNITVNTNNGSNITLCGDVTASGTLTWNNKSRIILDGHTMDVATITSSQAYGDSHMFVAGTEGSILKYTTNTANSSSLTLPIGTYNAKTKEYEYSPVTLASGITRQAGSFIAVQVADTAYSGKSTDLERYWQISATGVSLSSNARIQFKYDDSDDGLGYAADDMLYVYHDGTRVATGATINGGSYTITVDNPSSISGIWTAAEPAEIITLYSHRSGDWGDATMWTTDPTGKTEVGQARPDNSYNVVILNGHTVEASGATMNARSVKISAGATLNMGNNAQDHRLKNVYGQGMLRIEGDFPTSGNYKLFVSPDGGTTEFYGNHTSNDIPNQYEYNNLIFDYKTKVTRTITQNLKIHGNLTLKKGSLKYTKTNQSITVGGDIKIESDGGIYIYESGGDKSHADTLVVGGNFENHGEVLMTKRTIDTYKSSSEPQQDEGNKGRGVIRFVGEHDVNFFCYSTTNLSQLIIDKGTDETYRVTLYSSAESNFGLLGKATDFYTDYGDNTPDNPVAIYKPLWLKNGTLELTGNLHIYSLSEGGNDNFFIPLNGCLHLNGSNVIVDACRIASSNACLMPAGKLIIDAGTFDCSKSAGAVFRNTSEIYVNGGKLKGSQFRPSQYVSSGKTTFVQTGGEVIFDGSGEVKDGYAMFYMPFDTYTFKMTGGTLTVSGSTKSNNEGDGDVFAVNCNPENSKITGGEIIIINKDLSRKKSHGISCSIPLYNLTLLNPNNLTSSTDNYQFMFNDYNGTVNRGNIPISIPMSEIQILNNLTIGDNVTFNANGKDLLIGGNLTIAPTAKVYLKENEVIFNGDGSHIQQFTSTTTDKVKSGSNNNGQGYNNLTIAAGADVQINSDIVVNGLFTLGDGAIMRDGATNTYTIRKNAEISGTHLKPASGAGKILFNGDKPTITGNGHGSLNNVNVQLASGVLQIDAPNLTITGDLRLLNSTANNSGRVFVMGTSKLTFGSGANIFTDEANGRDYGEDKYIYTSNLASSGGVARVYSEDSKTFTFPIGTRNGNYFYYTPATITYRDADEYGVVTIRPVNNAHPLMGNTTNALKYYWATTETGFSGVGSNDVNQSYVFGNYNFVNGVTTTYVPARYYNAEWQKGSTSGMKLTQNAFEMITESANGDYTCGDPDNSFIDIVKMYSSNWVTSHGNEGGWSDALSWSADSVNGEPSFNIGETYYRYNETESVFKPFDLTTNDFTDGASITATDAPIPTSTTAVYIGSAIHNHTITMTENRQSCASLRIEPGSTLDLGVYINHTFSLVVVDETAEEGAGTLKISSTGNEGPVIYDGVKAARFPSGDFVKFLGEHGGTVHYYGNNSNTFYIPSVSESGLILTNYSNLIVGGNSFNHRIRIPNNLDLTIYRDFDINGYAHSMHIYTHTITVYGNLNVTNGELYIRDNSLIVPQHYIIYGDINIANNGKLYTDGASTGNVIHTIDIAGNLNVNGTYDAYYKRGANNYKIATTFFGTDTSRITGTGTVRFYTLTCDKGTDASAMLIAQNPHLSSAHDEDEAFLTLKHGTFQVDFPSDENEIELTRECDLTIETPTCLSVKSGTVNVANSNADFGVILNGSIDVQGGILNIGNAANDKSNSIIYSATSTPTITVSGGQINVNGIVRRTTGTRYGTLFYRQSGGEVVIKGRNRNATTAPDGNAALEIMNDGCEFTTTGGKLTLLASGGNETFGDLLIRPTTTSCTGGEIVINGDAEQKILSAASLHKITVKNGSQLDVYSHPITADSIVIEDNAIFNSRGFDLTIRQAMVNSNSSSASGIDKGGFLPGSITQTTYFTGTNVAFRGASGNKTNFANVEINGRFNLVGNTSNMFVNKNLVLANGKVSDNGSTIYLVGNLDNYGTFESSEATGGIDFCGAETEQYIIGIGTGTLGSVTIDNPHKVFMYNDVRVNNKLTLNAILYADIYLLTLGENATVAGDLSASSMILLNGAQEDKGVKKIIPSGTSDFTFPIGIDGYYTPARYKFSKNTSSKETAITIKTINYLNKNLSIDPDCYLNYFWAVTTDGFDEENDEKSDTNPYFTVEQTYTYPDDTETHFTANGYEESEMLPEYLRTLGDYEWIDLRPGAVVDASANTISFPPFGHIEGEYTAGVTHSTIYTALPILYSKQNGPWHEESTWQIKDEFGNWVPFTGTVKENPVHISSGHRVTVDANNTKSYCLYFDGASSKLDLKQTIGNDFGRVYGAGILIMEATSTHDYMFPAGNFDKFLLYPESVVEFSGDTYGTLPASPGNASRPLPNVVLSGSGAKKLPAGTAEVINGSLTIGATSTLDNTANNTKIIIKGDWIDNNPTTGFIAGSSIVEFNGDSTQRININNNETVFPYLVINSTGAKSDSIIVGDCDQNTPINKEFKVSKALTLTKGHVYTTFENCLVLSEPTTKVNGGNADAFVDGPLGKQLNVNGDFTFPIGNDKRFASTYISDANTAGIWKVEYVNRDPATDGYYREKTYLTEPITEVSSNEYWNIYPPTASAKANIKLRYDNKSFPYINTTAKLKKLTMVSFPTDDKWVEIKNGGASGSVSSGTITTTEAQTVDSKHYTFGYLGTTAKIDTRVKDHYYICDGNEENVVIPVVLSGTPKYTLQYSIDGGAPIAISDITGNTCNITLSGSELGGYKDTPYVISLVSVSDPSGTGDVYSDVVYVTVWYNATPVITGDDRVGRTDAREYSVATSAFDKSFLWEWYSGNTKITSGTKSVQISPNNSLSASTTTITFCANNSAVGTDNGEYRLKVTNTYTTDAGGTCSASKTMTVNVQEKPAPKIIGDLAVCEGDIRTYSTTYVSGHTYTWEVESGGSIKSRNANECTVEWGSSGTGVIKVTEKNTFASTTTTKETIYINEAATLGEVVVPQEVCYNTRGQVSIIASNSALQYVVCNASDESVIYGSINGNGNDQFIELDALTASTTVKVKAQNEGCAAPSINYPISVFANPGFAVEEIDDLYVGKPADIKWQQTTTSFSKINYKFTNISGSNSIGTTKVTDPSGVNTTTVDVAADAEEIRGILTVTETDTKLECHADYDIVKTVSQDYLWNGETSEDWNEPDNWWSGSTPTTAKNVRILEGATNMPEVSAAANAKDIIIGSGASVTVSGNTLTVAGNIENEGSFTATDGTVAFSSGTHSVSGANTFANLNNIGTVNFINTNTVNGDITNTGTINGSIRLAGSNSQSINGKGNYSNVEIDNAKGVSVNEDIKIDGNLALQNGTVTIASDKEIVFGTAASTTCNDASASAYVEGSMKKYGSSVFTFPTGHNGNRAKVGITPIDASDDTYFTAKYNSVAPDDAEEIPESKRNSGLERVSNLESWDIFGTSDSKIKLYWENKEDDYITNLKTLVVAHYNSILGKWETVKCEGSDGDGSKGWILTGKVSSYSPFTFGSTVKEDNPLPVTFTTFAGRQDGNSVVLEWATASENNNNYFEIERSIDGVNFVTIGYVDGAGNSSSLLNYEFTDNAPEQGQLYYRLSQVDFDGKREFADKVVAVLYTGSEIENLTIVPNPTDGLFRVSVTGSMAGGRIELLSQAGKMIRIVDVESYDATIDISDLPSGMYVLRFVTDTKVLQQKVVKY